MSSVAPRRVRLFRAMLPNRPQARVALDVGRAFVREHKWIA